MGESTRRDVFGIEENYYFIKMDKKESNKRKLPDNTGMHQHASFRIFQNAYRLRGCETEPEKVLWNKVSKKQLGSRFRRQHPVGNYIADFYCHQALLVIEIDGDYHQNPEQQKADEARSLDLESSGLKVIRFRNEEIMNELAKVLEKIKSYL